MTIPPDPPVGGYGPAQQPWLNSPPGPGYPGYPNQPYPAYPGPGYPPVDPSGGLRSARKKLLTIAGVLLGSALIAGVLAGWLFSGIFTAQPPAAAQFDSGGSTTVDFKAGETKMIYAQSPDTRRHKFACNVNSPEGSDGLSIDPVDADITINDWKAGMS